MKVFELIAHLQQMPADAEAYIGWTELNDSGTAWDTGTKVSVVSEDAPHCYHRKCQCPNVVTIR